MLSFFVNRATRSWRRKFADWASDTVSDVFDLDPKATRKYLGGAVMLTTGIGTSIALADVTGLFDPSNITDVATALDVGDATDATTSLAGVDPGALGVHGAASHGLHFGSQYVNPGDPIYGYTPDGDPVGWSNGHYINDRTWGEVKPYP